MEIEVLKLGFIGDKIQVVIFDEQGKILQSCDSLIKFKQEESIFDQFVALEAIKDEVLNLENNDSLYYPCMNNSFGELGYHDFHFRRLKEHSDAPEYVWYIHDLSSQYEKLSDLQQSRNENFIEKERLLKKNKELKIKQELDFKPELESARHVFIKNDSLLLNFDLSELYYAEAYGDYVKLHTFDKTYLVYTTMKKVEDKLPGSEFVRVHRSFIVRLDKISNIHANNLEIKDRIIPISSLNKSKLMEKIDII